MNDNQPSSFDARCIRFPESHNYRIRYDIENPDITIMRNGRFAVNNKATIRVKKQNDDEFIFLVIADGTVVKRYTRSWIMDFVKYSKTDETTCYCECENCHD